VFLYFPAIFQSIFFALILEFASFYKGFFWTAFFVLIAFSLASYRLIAKSWTGWYVALAFFVSVWTILHLIDYDMEKYIFIGINTLVNYFLFFGAYRINSKPESRTAKGVLAMILMAIVFLFFASTYGVYLNFDVSAWILMAFYFFNIVLISYQYFLLVGEKKRSVILVYSLILGFGSLEMAWTVNFWPFGYLTTGVVMLMFYYIIWDLAQNYFSNILSKQKVVMNLIFFVLASSVVLYSSIWLPNL